jgi:phosphate transport system substrate-binding protein
MPLLSRSTVPAVVILSLLLFFSVTVKGSSEGDEVINGAGASFPNPLYQEWAKSFAGETGVTINYDSIGSGGGQKAIKEKRVLFAGSDAPMSRSQLEKFGLLQFPMVTGAVVPVVNIPGIENGKLKLTGDLLARIFLKDISHWDHRDILALQTEEVKKQLSKLPISVVVRQDSSGSTWVFTYYLHQASEFWRNGTIDFGKKPSWEADFRGHTNDGVGKMVKETQGSIGYVEFAYVSKYGLKTAALQNKDREFVIPGSAGFKTAAKLADWSNAPENFEINMINLSGRESWPIMAVTYILIHRHQDNTEQINSLISFFDYCYVKGSKTAEFLNYVPLPEKAIKMIKEKVWSQIVIRK